MEYSIVININFSQALRYCFSSLDIYFFLILLQIILLQTLFILTIICQFQQLSSYRMLLKFIWQPMIFMIS